LKLAYKESIKFGAKIWVIATCILLFLFSLGYVRGAFSFDIALAMTLFFSFSFVAPIAISSAIVAARKKGFYMVPICAILIAFFIEAVFRIFTSPGPDGFGAALFLLFIAMIDGVGGCVIAFYLYKKLSAKLPKEGVRLRMPPVPVSTHKEGIKFGAKIWITVTCLVLFFSALNRTFAYGAPSWNVLFFASCQISLFFVAPLAISSAVVVAYAYLGKKRFYIIPVCSTLLTLCIYALWVGFGAPVSWIVSMYSFLFWLLIDILGGSMIGFYMYERPLREKSSK